LLKKVLIGAVLFSLLLVAVACSSETPTAPSPSVQKPAVTETPSTAPKNSPAPATAPTEVSATTPKPSGPIKAKWIDVQVNGDSVTIPQSEIVNNWNIHFKVGSEAYMAYFLDGKIYVRANVCPPCRSIGFSLDRDILVCDRCRTTFEAKSGDGIKGACVKFPKASVSYEVNGDSITMTKGDLLTAHQNTQKQGRP
jgi:nitrite reductase/ring-hydroxylating ferredoxin subunit